MLARVASFDRDADGQRHCSLGVIRSSLRAGAALICEILAKTSSIELQTNLLAVLAVAAEGKEGWVAGNKIMFSVV